MRIRITSTPPGRAPEEVREKWVGIEFESIGREEAPSGGLRLGTENMGGYQVRAEVAFAALAKHSPEAHRWWTEGAPWDLMNDTLIFRADVCEEISD